MIIILAQIPTAATHQESNLDNNRGTAEPLPEVGLAPKSVFSKHGDGHALRCHGTKLRPV